MVHRRQGEGYEAPLCSLILISGETNVCDGTNMPGHDYIDDPDPMDDLE